MVLRLNIMSKMPWVALAVRHPAVRLCIAGAFECRICNENNDRVRPVMLHRAILGSLERFIGSLIENHAGSFPLWLAPVQMVIMNITENQADYCREVAAKLQAAGFVSNWICVTKKSVTKSVTTANTVSLSNRRRHKEKQETKLRYAAKAEDLGSLNVDDFIAQLQQEITDALVNH